MRQGVSPLHLIFLSLVTGFFAVLSMLSPAVARTWLVPGDWASLQEALVAAQNADTVLAAAGLHSGPVDFLGKEVALRSQSGAALTSIVADSTCGLVRFVSGEGPDALLEGFTLAGGLCAGGDGVCGGALRVENASPTIRGCILRDNEALVGGAACLLGSGARIESTVFLRNQAELGGALYAMGGAPVVVDARFQDNAAVGASFGGGVYVEDCAAQVEACAFLGNTARLGGALVCRQHNDSLSTLARNSLCDNSADFGGGFYLNGGAPRLEGNIVAFSGEGEALWCQNSLPELACNIFHGNAGGNAFCGTDAGGNLEEDPLFCNADTGDLRLQAASPAWSTSCGVAGAFQVNCDGVDVPSPPRHASCVIAIKAAPNPFNPTTVLHLDLPVAGTVELACYNVLGCRERTLLSGSFLPEGHHALSFSGEGLPAGLHFLRLESGTRHVVTRVLYLP